MNVSEEFFHTPRLIARRFRQGDSDFLCQMQANEKVMRYITGRAKSIEESEEELCRILDAYTRRDNDFLVMALEQAATGRLVGSCAVVGGEIGFRLEEACWGHGYGREVFAGLSAYCLETLGMAEITAEVDEENTACIRILESGMIRIETNTDPSSGKRAFLYRLTGLDHGA